MIKRLLVGLVTGFAVGAIVAVALVQGLGMTAMGAVTAYLLAAGTGALTGLIAGKPIWSKGGQIEAGLKTFFGALLAVGMMFVLRMWVHFDVDLRFIHAGGPDEIGNLPAAAFPAIAALLGAFFEADNTGDDESKEGKEGEKKRVATDSKARVAEPEEAEEEEDDAAAEKKSKK
jgi:hypothetical protein